MKIRWKNVYYPEGDWVSEDNVISTKLTNFRATYQDKPILVIHREVTTSGGHGDPSMTGMWPMFIKEDTLEEIKLSDDEYIVIDFPVEFKEPKSRRDSSTAQ